MTPVVFYNQPSPYVPFAAASENCAIPIQNKKLHLFKKFKSASAKFETTKPILSPKVTERVEIPIQVVEPSPKGISTFSDKSIDVLDTPSEV